MNSSLRGASNMPSTPFSRSPQDLIKEDARRVTRRVVFIMTAAVAGTVAIFLLWSLRSIILPCIIGIFIAYLCFPILKMFTRVGLPRPVGILLLFCLFIVIIMGLANQVSKILPDERDRLVLRTRFQYKLNERYRSLMGIDREGEKGNIVYRYFGEDFDRFLKSINAFLELDENERELFLRYCSGYGGKPKIPDRYYQYFLANTGNVAIKEDAKPEMTDEAERPDAVKKESPFTSIMAAVKLWIIMPLVFLFLLTDDGEIKRFFIGLVPNRYFEVSLAVVDKVNRAIGNYLRGILSECALVGACYAALFSLIGFEVRIALIIGAVAGIANAIPMGGLVVAFGLGSAYALIAEEVSSILPFIHAGNLIVAVALCVLVVMVLDNAVFQPFVVGGAVKLHPLVVFLGIIGGSMLFGFAGLILAIPTIVVVKEFISTLFRELKDYFII